MRQSLTVLIGLTACLLLTACPKNTPPSADAPSIEGVVWEDSDRNASQNSGEPGLAERTIYLDTNNNGQLDGGETSVKTDAQGKYKFSKLEPGSYTVRQVLPFGWRQVSGGDETQTSLRDIVSSQLASGPQDRGSRIVGGVPADISKLPFIAAVGFEREAEDGSKSFRQFCGGTLIADTWVLTAAHCSLNDDETKAADPVANNYRVMLGDANISGENGLIVPVKRIVLHPSFDLELNVAGGYDAALWELSNPVTLKDKFYTTGLLDKATEALAAEGTLATAAGWGTLSSGGPSPDVLQLVHVPISNAEQCQETQPDSTNFDTQICASVPEGGIDSCQGDSGGPLFVKNKAANGWYQAGITSYGNGCALPGEPGIYARVSVLSDWIKTTATLSSRSYTVTLKETSEIKAINFGNQASTRTFTDTIDPRWQTTNLAPKVKNPSPNDQVTYNWRIIDEGVSNFTCKIDLDGPGPSVSTDTPCQEGDNTFTSPAGYAEGVYLPELTVSKDGQTQARQIPLIIGNPIADTEMGEISATDPTDPNYDQSYYIDYYTLDLTGIPANTAVLIRLEAEFNSFMAVYDPADFNKTDGGPEINSGGAELILVTDGTPSYILGISTSDEKATGAYTLTTSNGTLSVF